MLRRPMAIIDDSGRPIPNDLRRGSKASNGTVGLNGHLADGRTGTWRMVPGTARYLEPAEN